MKVNGIAVVAGEQLKMLRHRLGLTTRQVAKLSQQVADAKNNPQFVVSHAWLTEIESAETTPGMFKLYSLSIIYRYKFEDILALFGLDLSKTNGDILSTSFGPSFQPEKTNILSRMIEDWSKIPFSMVSNSNFGKTLYGYIGLDDFTLYPLVRPGSFVEIDSRQNKIDAVSWQSEFERPIYFIDVRGSYVCGWCELDGHKLTVVPHPQSKQEVRHFQYPTQAGILGRVVFVAMRIVDAQDDTFVAVDGTR